MRNLVVISIIALTVAGCASSPEHIAPAAVSETPYLGWTCQHLSQESQRLGAELTIASAKQRTASNNDALGVFLLGLPLASMSGGDIAPQVALLKGEVEAVHKASATDHCSETPPPAAQNSGAGSLSTGATPALVASTGPLDVPFRIDLQGQQYAGVGRLENGHFAGQVQYGNQTVVLAGDIKGDNLSVGATGGLNSNPGRDSTATTHCTAEGSASPAKGTVTVPMRASCAEVTVPVTLYLDLPAV